MQTQVAVIGAGPGGTTAAMSMARKGLDCILLDKAVFPRDKICGDALSGKVVEAMNRIDPAMTDRFEQMPYSLGCWGVTFFSPKMERLDIPFRLQMEKGGELPVKAPGYVVPRMDFDNFLLDETARYPGIQILQNTAATGFEKQDNGWLIRTPEGKPDIKTSLIIAADGAQSRFARQVAQYQMLPDHHSAAIRAYYKGVEGLNSDNFIELHFLKEFLPGYFWIFPLSGGRANVGLGMRSDHLSKHKVNLKKKLPELIERIPGLRERFKNAQQIGKVSGFGLPLGSVSRPLSGDGYMLVGDAGSLIDPFTGEGIGNAMISGMLAGHRAVEAVKETRFDVDFLKEYDKVVDRRLGHELKLSYRMQLLVHRPWLFNFVVRRANRSKTLRETLTCMFEDLEVRKRLKNPVFYFKLLVS